MANDPALPSSTLRVAFEGIEEDDADCVVGSIGTRTEGVELEELEELNEDDFSVTFGTGVSFSRAAAARPAAFSKI